ncbi:uncharacterized protein K444DRAFT_301185 [Hyaloscypha bicolor E]|uniref:Uncharacterized protein n=1 Tax=Hyaloscypha bicolor E TaxID=1095630 RepID=A0A2J6SEC2_9HELO|nr:uncharacterized protein K444DRAFT_301185 [Hyaloscypha bicolor E]PMD49108.1 hypothetical protein K444DRAFT_301185 [Hyaloscypha bicolor E]
MASQKPTDHFNMHNGSSLHAGAPQPYDPYLREPYNSSSTQIPEHYMNGHHENKGDSEGVHEQISTIATLEGGSLFQGLHGWDDGCGVGGFSSHNPDPGDKRNHGNAFGEWERLFPELGFWGETNDAVPVLGDEFTVSAVLTGNGFKPTVESWQMPISTNVGKANFHSYPHILLDTEESRGVMEETESPNLSERKASLFAQSPTAFRLFDQSSLPAPPNSDSNGRLLEHGVSNKQDSILFHPPDYQHLTSSVSKAPTVGKSYISSSNESTDCGLQLDCFDDSFTVLPPQMFETTHIPHDATVPSTQDSQSSYLCLTGLLQYLANILIQECLL